MLICIVQLDALIATSETQVFADFTRRVGQDVREFEQKKIKRAAELTKREREFTEQKAKVQ
jgi:hypothetical protein